MRVPTPGDDPRLAGDDPWLVVVDMQVVFADPASAWCAPRAADLVEPIATLAGRFAGRVVLTRFVAPEVPAGAWAHYYETWPFALQPPDAPIYRLLPGLPVGPVVESSSFSKWGPDLRTATRGSRHLVVCGVATDCCVLMTALAAADDGVAVTVVGDACAAADDATHARALELLRPFDPLIRVTTVAGAGARPGRCAQRRGTRRGC